MPQPPAAITLSDITLLGRRAVKFGSIGLVVLIVGRMLWGAGYGLYKALNPEPPPPPTVGFGLLPPITFPTQSDSVKPSSYVLETPTGTLPVFSDRAKVFFMPQTAPSLLADQAAKELAAKLNFIFEPQVLNARSYRWTRSQPLETVFELDIQNQHFTLTTNYQSRPELLSPADLPDNASAVQRVKQVLQSVDLLADDVATASGEIVYLKAVGTELEPAVSFSDADFLRVDLNRHPIDSMYRMFTPEGYTGTITAIVAGGGLGGAESLVEFQNRYQPVDYTEIHTYPLRSTQSAWRLLQSGEGYIAQSSGSDQAVIRSVELGYYDSFTEQSYLQPIYVFKGDNDFLGYVPALDPEYLQQLGGTSAQ